jgi:hypothetical protein
LIGRHHLHRRPRENAFVAKPAAIRHHLREGIEIVAVETRPALPFIDWRVDGAQHLAIHQFRQPSIERIIEP